MINHNYYYSDIYNLRHLTGKEASYLLVTEPHGSGGFVDTYFFYDNELVWEQEGIYHGEAFIDKEGLIVTIEAVAGEANCCPDGYILTRLHYNLDTGETEIVESERYETGEARREEGFYEKDLEDWILHNRDDEHRINLRNVITNISEDVM